MKVEERVAVVTGASRGLGRALGEALAARGARVVLVSKRWDEVEAVAQGIRERAGVAFALEADLGDGAGMSALAAEAAALAGPVDILIHNASELGPVPLELLLDTPRERFERAFRVNVLGPFALSRALVGGMVVRGGGCVVHISSDAAVNAYPKWGAYGASKAALDHLTRVFAAELEPAGVRFFGVDPGEMDTRMHSDALPEADRTQLGRPEDVAARIVRLIEDEVVPSSPGATVAAFH